ncbi:Erg28 like protein-domain-containing protein [Peziza echinospora]|nr:Erg28 like protein-domain-containing protein [Peziza echinospora]
MDALIDQLPGPGLLPKWLLLVSTIALGNSIQSYMTTTFTKRVYAVDSDKNVTPLSSRTFGTWTILSAIIRGYAAYNMHNAQLYNICILSYVLAFAHFASEWLVFGTARFGEGLVGPLVVSTASFAWMVAQRGEYLAGAGGV